MSSSSFMPNFMASPLGQRASWCGVSLLYVLSQSVNHTCGVTNAGSSANRHRQQQAASMFQQAPWCGFPGGDHGVIMSDGRRAGREEEVRLGEM
jgi:hypothetical protein